MERRKAIKSIGFSVGALVASPSVLSLLQSCQQKEVPWIPSFYTEEQGRFVKNIIDNMLPPSGNLPGAIEVNAHVFIDKMIKEVISVDDKPNFRKTVEVAMRSLLQDTGESDIGSVEEQGYVDFLTKHLTKSKEEDTQLMSEIYSYLGENNNSMNGMEERLVVYQFLTQIRGFAVWAYQRSEQVGENVLAYKSIPGEQRGCVDLQETTGGRAWSLYYL